MNILIYYIVDFYGRDIFFIYFGVLCIFVKVYIIKFKYFFVDFFGISLKIYGFLMVVIMI